MLLGELVDVLPSGGPMRDRPRVGEILVAAGIIDEMQLEAALGEQSRWGRRLGVTLIKMGMVEEGHLIRALAKQLDLPVASLAGKRIPESVIALVPARVASEHGVIPLFTKEGGPSGQLYLGMEDPSNLAVLDDLSFRTGMEIHPVMVGPSELGEAIDRYYHGRSGGAPQADPFHSSSGDTMNPASLRIVTDDSAHPGTAPAEADHTIESEIARHTPAREAQIELSEPVTTPARPAVQAPAPVTPAAPVAPSPAPSPASVAASAPAPPVVKAPEPAPAPTPIAAPVVAQAPAIPDGLIEDVATAIEETERTRVVAKAIAQLLVEKGLLSLDELQSTIAEIKAAKAADDAATEDA